MFENIVFDEQLDSEKFKALQHHSFESTCFNLVKEIIKALDGKYLLDSAQSIKAVWKTSLYDKRFHRSFPSFVFTPPDITFWCGEATLKIYMPPYQELKSADRFFLISFKNLDIRNFDQSKTLFAMSSHSGDLVKRYLHEVFELNAVVQTIEDFMIQGYFSSVEAV